MNGLAAPKSFCDLEAAVARDTFRMDLFYRLNVFPIDVPPLRERTEDIPALVEYFVQQYASRLGKEITTVSKQTLKLFQAYHWPGNIRQLENTLFRAVVMAEGDIVADGPTARVVGASPSFAPQVAKIMAPLAYLTVDQLRYAMAQVSP